ncbi:MAG: Arc family DNA-binding protein [Chloroflexi bacterium]|nr:Arc family DNA-binding protein [Chloroflexota bacterium]
MTVNLSIKKVPDELAERLRERAKRNHRSIQGELMSILHDTLAPRNLTVEEARRMVKELRLKTGDESTAIIRELRDAR